MLILKHCSFNNIIKLLIWRKSIINQSVDHYIEYVSFYSIWGGVAFMVCNVTFKNISVKS